jgi:hypothetical protein
MLRLDGPSDICFDLDPGRFVDDGGEVHVLEAVASALRRGVVRPG